MKFFTDLFSSQDEKTENKPETKASSEQPAITFDSKVTEIEDGSKATSTEERRQSTSSAGATRLPGSKTSNTGLQQMYINPAKENKTSAPKRNLLSLASSSEGQKQPGDEKLEDEKRADGVTIVEIEKEPENQTFSNDQDTKPNSQELYNSEDANKKYPVSSNSKAPSEFSTLSGNFRINANTSGAETEKLLSQLDKSEESILASVQKQGDSIKKLKTELRELKADLSNMRKNNHTLLGDIDDLQLHELRDELSHLTQQQEVLRKAILKDQIIQQNVYQNMTINYLTRLEEIREGADVEDAVFEYQYELQNYWMEKMAQNAIDAHSFAKVFPSDVQYKQQKSNQRSSSDTEESFQKLTFASGYYSAGD